MKILYLKLKNFKALENTMNATEVEIDLSKMNNRMCLLIGPNGSGKTTLLSMLHPFASIGNLDVRDGLKLITENKEGYKEIQYKVNDDTYIIKHFYTPKKDKSHSVKSFIMKNGIELNENGNVTSFKEIVNMELGLDIDFLRLIRVGNNVSSMIDLSDTERKNFMSKLLDDLGVYLIFYKKVNGDLLQLKEMISHNINKLNKLGIDDVKEIQTKIKTAESNLVLYQKTYGDLSGQESVYEHEIESINEPELLKSHLSEIHKKVSKMEKILEKKDQLASTDVKFYVDIIDKLNKKIISTENELKTSSVLIQNYLEHLDETETSLRDVEIQYRKELESDKELKHMKNQLTDMVHTSIQIEKNIAGFNPLFSKKDIDDLIVFIRNSQRVLDKIYEYGKGPVGNVVKLLRENKNVMHYINSHITYADDEEDVSILLCTLAKRFDFNNKDIFNCDSDCEAKKLWKQMANILKDREIIDKQNDNDFYQGMESCYKIIVSVLSDFSRYGMTIEKLPENAKKMFKLEKIYSCIEDLKPIYNENILNELLGKITEYDNYINLNKEIDNLRNNVEKFKAISRIDYISNQRDELIRKGEDMRDKISSMKNHINELNEEIKNNKYDLEFNLELKETFEKYDDLKTVESNYIDDYNKYINNFNNLNTTKNEIQKTLFMIESTNKEIQNMQYSLSLYLSIKKELKKFDTIYDEMSLTKDSIYSKKGIPLYYMKKYLGNVSEMTNKLLNIAYDGKIYIDDFIITPTSFQIPWFKNGKIIEDVKYASQGELSFLSVSLSFALATQALKKIKNMQKTLNMYNIWLLDEPDSQLDALNREKFIRIVENQNEAIDCEQCFIITHNNMFASYPIDIIDLSFGDPIYHSDNYKYANFVDIIRK